MEKFCVILVNGNGPVSHELFETKLFSCGPKNKVKNVKNVMKRHLSLRGQLARFQL